jgi:hypothetical protein
MQERKVLFLFSLFFKKEKEKPQLSFVPEQKLQSSARQISTTEEEP